MPRLLCIACTCTCACFLCCDVDATYGDVTACQQIVRLFCKPQSCGRPTKDPNPNNNILSKVVNGDSGDIEAWPWMASLHRVGACLKTLGARLQTAGARLQTVGARLLVVGEHPSFLDWFSPSFESASVFAVNTKRLSLVPVLVLLLLLLL